MMGKEVVFQGEMLKILVENIEDVKQNITDAESELEKTKTHSQRQFKNIIIISVCIFFIICLLITIIVLTVK
jgi:t-SNARE complex subunit (syntaxin)